MTTKGDRFIVCTGCSGGADLAAALKGRVAVETTDCMNVCDKPISLAVRAEGKAAYLFTGVDPDTPEDIEAFAEIVNRAGYSSPVRKPRGRDIFAACGQLKTESLRERKSA